MSSSWRPTRARRDKEAQLPAVFVIGNVTKFDDGQFGDGKVHLVATTPYDIFCLAQDTSWLAAYQDAKTLGTRVRESLRLRPNLLYLGSTPVSTINETVRRMLIGSLDVWVNKQASAGGGPTGSGVWRGLARLSVDVEAQIESCAGRGRCCSPSCGVVTPTCAWSDAATTVIRCSGCSRTAMVTAGCQRATTRTTSIPW